MASPYPLLQVGTEVNHWTVIAHKTVTYPNGETAVRLECRCRCGTVRLIQNIRLLNPKRAPNSCGCVSRNTRKG